MDTSNLPTSRAFVNHLLSSLRSLPQASAGTINVSVAAAPNRLNSVSEPTKKQLLTLHVLFPSEFLPALDLLDRRLVTRFRIRRKPNEDDAAPPIRNAAQYVSLSIRGSGRRDGEATQAIDGGAQRETSAPNTVTAAAQKNTSDTEMTDGGSTVPHMEEPEDLTRLPQIFEEEARIEVREGGLAAQQQDIDTVYYVRSAQQRSSRYGTSYDSTTSYEVRIRAWNCSCPAFAFAAFPSTHPERPVPEITMEDTFKEVMEDVSDFGGFSLGDEMPPVCKHLLACVLIERCDLFRDFVEEKEISVNEAAGWAAGWGD
jgi:hypothetical protein